MSVVREPPPRRSQVTTGLIALIGVAVVVLVVALLALRDGSPSASPTQAPPSSPVAAASPTPAASVTAAATASPPATASASGSPPASVEPSRPAASTDGSPSAGATTVASPSGPALPDTPLEAPLDEAYTTSGEDYDPAELGGLQPGDVTARWYVDGDRWVVHYEDLDLAATGPLCPGNSIQTPAGFEHVSNAPTEPDACELFETTLASPPVGVRLCGDEVLYLTEIPADAEGTLRASIERATSDGAFTGLTSMVETTAGEPPAIDLEALGCEAVEPA